jgi:uncharacterized membrane protein YgdD (TMEM256/DUF423 family)
LIFSGGYLNWKSLFGAGMARYFIFLGSLNAFLAVGLGAFGAHGLKSRISPEMLDVYQTGVQYHVFHALALILIGIIAHWLSQSNLIIWSGGLFLAGIIIFSGSLYVLSITGIRAFGAITPVGGIAFLIGWVLLAWASLKNL